MATEKIVIAAGAVKPRKKKPPPLTVHRDRRLYTRKVKHRKKAPERSEAFFVRADRFTEKAGNPRPARRPAA